MLMTLAARVRSLLAIACLAASLALPGVARAQGQSFPTPLTGDQIQDVRATLEAMRNDPRGPYLRIRWFCADGSILPPQPYACSERGGGVQHAEYSEAAKKLASLHLHIGTILQATHPDSLFDAAHNHHWLKELILQQYLREVDDGWVLRQARFYRGAKQIENEEQRGKELLESVLAKPAWVRANYLLASRLAAVIPHPGPGGDRTSERIRNLASEIADLDRGFQAMRVKIHSFPSRDDLDSIEVRLANRTVRDTVRARLIELRDELRRQYDPRQTLETLAWYQPRLPTMLGNELGTLRETYEQGQTVDAFRQIAVLTPRLRDSITTGTNGRRNLVLMDLSRSLLQLAFVLAQDLEEHRQSAIPRRQRIVYINQLLNLAYGAGFLSQRELAALREETDHLIQIARATALEYRAALNYLGRSLEWSTASVRSVFGPTINHYSPVEPEALGLIDAELRGSILLPLSLELGRLSIDADQVLGASHSIFGQRINQGVRGLNPGIAFTTLEVVEPDRVDVHLEQNKIYVLPATTAEMRPVAGVITLDEGNLLSHVQLLARNLGIPNAAITPSNRSVLQRGHGREVLFAVSPLGRVIVKTSEQMNAADRRLLDQGRRARVEKVQLNTDRLRLDRTEPVPLAELRAEHSGMWVGPKAANLGQLAFYFPERVAPGVALPFGLFYEHVNRRFGDSPRTVLEELDEGYERSKTMRAAGASEEEIDRFMFGVLARVRQAIMELEWQPETKRTIERAIDQTFGQNVRRGVFVRSDTNVEDLPQFSGAGLNLTVPHLVTTESLLNAVRRVWTSPFSERAYLWRKQILEDLGQIYPSVLLLQSVHSEKSGVLITSGLDIGSPNDLTVATAEGVGGAVEGEETETIVVRPNGTVRLLSQAKAPARRALLNAGGSAMIPSQRPDVLVSTDEVRQLQQVVRDWKSRFAPSDQSTVWDIEFGFVDGKLWLFQIRPFIRFRSSQLLDRLRVLDDDIRGNEDRVITMETAI